ncbi:MAG: PHP domain-containing protein [Symbiobacteriia bacterium]
MSEGRADLHAHTTASDGTLTPAELVAAALDAGLRAVGICDHDTSEGVAPAQAAARGTSLEVVPGVEINTNGLGREVHVLGYFYRSEDSALTALLARMRNERQNRARRMVEKLAQGGYHLSLQRVQELAGEGAIGRPHVARALVEAGIAGSERDAFTRFLTPGCPGYVERYKLAPAEAVRTVLAAGGVPVLAHPGLVGRDELIGELAAVGVVGLEVYHPDHDTAAEERYLGLAQRYHLLVTGGSDFHGPGHGHDSSLGQASVPYAAVGALRARAR